MSDIVIRAENLGKSYIIGHEKREHYVALRDVVTNKVKQIAGKTRQIINGSQLIAGNQFEEFWALRDVNFEIKHGDRMGIIGRNGAGKSTLLKVLSRITEPTMGRVQIKGRIASLLEVGTGFHPELTGRENIYLNGAILGMSRLEIKKKFDEIVDFSGVEKFLDTPVKRYSSGMYVRLAFSVAANLESNILIVDEVLAVGDAEFQRKCLGKMSDISNAEGRTVLFVSHNMGAIESLCEKTILMGSGSILSIGNTKDVVNEYLTCSNRSSDTQIALRTDRRGTGRLFFDDISIDDNQIWHRSLHVDLSINNRSKEEFRNVLLSIVIHDEMGRSLSNLVNYIVDDPIYVGQSGAKIRITINNLNLIPGTYSISPFVSSDIQNGEIFDWVLNAVEFYVPDYDFYDTGHIPYVKGEVIYLDYKFNNI